MTSMQPVPRGRTTGLMAGLMMAVLLALMDQTVVSTALPTVVGDLGGLSLYTWVFSAYLLCQTSFLPIFGKLSDLYGRRLFFLMGLGLFMGGSILAGQSQTMEQLILFRGMQGIGGAGLMPIALAILGYHYGPRERARLQGILGTAGGLAVVVGPSVGSFIVENLSWRWIFYVNLPLGLLSALFIVLFLGESRRDSEGSSVDYTGALSLIGWVVALMLAFFYSSDYGWFSLEVVGLLATAATLFAAFIVAEMRADQPILPLRIFRDRTVASAAAVTAIRSTALYSLTIFTPLLVQGVLGGTDADARNALTIFAVPGIAGAVAAGFLVSRNASYRALTLVALTIFGFGLWLVTGAGVGTSESNLLLDLAIAGLGIGLTQVTIILAIQNSIPRQYMGTASSLAQFLTNLSGTIGTGLVGTYQSGLLSSGVKGVLSSPSIGQLPSSLVNMLSDPTTLQRILVTPTLAAKFPSQLVQALREALATSIQNVFAIGLALTLASILVAAFMRGSAATSESIEDQSPGVAVPPGQGDQPNGSSTTPGV